MNPSKPSTEPTEPTVSPKNISGSYAKLRSTKQVIYEALPGAAYRLKDRAYIVDSRGCIQRVDIPKELMNFSTPTPVGNQVSEPVFIPHPDKAILFDEASSTDEADS